MKSLAVQIALALIERFEAVRLRPYLCPAGIPTIGIGATYYEDGAHVTLHDAPITKQRAFELCVWMVETVYLPAVMRQCPGIDNPKRLAAVIDWTFNLGESNLRHSNMRRRVNAGRWADVPAEIRKWDKAGGRRMRGLTIRREAEVALI